MAEIRLDKLLSNRSNYSRRDIRNALKQGIVTVDGIVEHDGGRKINPDEQQVCFQGRQIIGGSHVYFLVDKPVGYICATEDAVHPVVLDLVPPAMRVKGLFPVGRLDIDSTGMVLLTDDGELAHRMLAPKSHVPKYYLVRLERTLTEAEIREMADGLTLGDGTACMPAQAQALPGNAAIICLEEGKYHQVKRMMAYFGNHVKHLHRVAVGGLLLPETLSPGGCLEIFHKDIAVMLKTENFTLMCEQIVKRFSSYSLNERL